MVRWGKVLNLDYVSEMVVDFSDGKALHHETVQKVLYIIAENIF